MSINPRQIEISNLGHCNIENQLIAIKIDEEDGPKITSINRKELTCWQRFLHLFKLGKFANYRYSLHEVSRHLCDYNWIQFSEADQNTEQWQAYYKVCQFAGKSLLHRRNRTLWENVSRRTEATVTLNQRYQTGSSVTFIQRHRGRYFSTYNTVSIIPPERTQEFSTTRTFSYNPACQVRHIVEDFKQQFSLDSRIVIRNREGMNLTKFHAVHTPEEAGRISIRIEQNFKHHPAYVLA